MKIISCIWLTGASAGALHAIGREGVNNSCAVSQKGCHRYKGVIVYYREGGRANEKGGEVFFLITRERVVVFFLLLVS